MFQQRVCSSSIKSFFIVRTKLTESLEKKSELKSEYDKTIEETEAAFRKIVESSCTLIHVLKREAKNLGSTEQQQNDKK